VDLSHISDFTDGADGFTASDFDELVARGTIEISEEPRSGVQRETESKREVAIGGDDEDTAVLPDVLEPGLRVVFCGTAVGAASARVGAYYAQPGKQFWAVLARVGLTPRRLSPDEFRVLPKYGIGLTDLAKAASGGDPNVGKSDFDVDSFRRKLEALTPRVVAFNGKRAARVFFGRPVEYGRQDQPIGETAIFVLPSTSGAARGYWDESHWLELAEFCDSDS
jgi:TDG/mug DNA glycosylase family protein